MASSYGISFIIPYRPTLSYCTVDLTHGVDFVSTGCATGVCNNLGTCDISANNNKACCMSNTHI